MMDKLMQLMQGMDEEQAKNLMSQLDEQQIHEGIQGVMNMYVVPELHEVRRNAENYPPADQVRETYKNAPEEKQQELFDEAVIDLLVTAEMIRERPPAGMRRLKTYLRDPTVTEALLLIFENEAIDDDYAEQLKDYAAEHIHHAGVFLMPEMYDEAEVERVLQLYDTHPQ